MGVTLDPKSTFVKHAKVQAEKSDKTIQNISWILPNISAAKQRKRILLSNAAHSLLLYGAPVWAHRMNRPRWNILAKAQRRAALRVASAYRTVSYDAVLVVAGISPIRLQAKQRSFIYSKRNEAHKEETRKAAYR